MATSKDACSQTVVSMITLHIRKAFTGVGQDVVVDQDASVMFFKRADFGHFCLSTSSGSHHQQQRASEPWGNVDVREDC